MTYPTFHSPLELEILLWHYTRINPYPYNITSTYKELSERLVELGAMKPTVLGEKEFKVTDLGKAWIENILATPVPVVEYRDPRFPARYEWKKLLETP